MKLLPIQIEPIPGYRLTFTRSRHRCVFSTYPRKLRPTDSPDTLLRPSQSPSCVSEYFGDDKTSMNVRTSVANRRVIQCMAMLIAAATCLLTVQGCRTSKPDEDGPRKLANLTKVTGGHNHENAPHSHTHDQRSQHSHDHSHHHGDHSTDQGHGHSHGHMNRHHHGESLIEPKYGGVVASIEYRHGNETKAYAEIMIDDDQIIQVFLRHPDGINQDGGRTPQLELDLIVRPYNEPNLFKTNVVRLNRDNAFEAFRAPLPKRFIETEQFIMIAPKVLVDGRRASFDLEIDHLVPDDETAQPVPGGEPNAGDSQ